MAYLTGLVFLMVCAVASSDNVTTVPEFDLGGGYEILDFAAEEPANDTGRSLLGSFASGVCRSPCYPLSNGQCVDSSGRFYCRSIPVETSLFDQVASCSSTGCANGGFCESFDGKCTCVVPYCGDLCDQQCRPPAFSLPCSNHCRNGDTCFHVRFPNGDYGHRCVWNRRDPQEKPDLCIGEPCFNGGTCYHMDDFVDFLCECPPPYYGRRCELTPLQPQGPCSTNHCRNSCECVPSCRHASGYYCRSANGYLGKNCTVPPPVVNCQPNQVVVAIDNSFVREYDMDVRNSRLMLARDVDALSTADICFATTNGAAHTFIIPLPFSRCGVAVDTSSGKTVVTGNVWLNRITQAAYDMPVPVVSFQCTYEKEYVIVTSLEPALDRPVSAEAVGYTRIEGVMELCKVSACPRACPAEFSVTQGAIYTVGETVHLNIRPRVTSQFVVALKSLYLSCDGTTPAVSTVQLVQNGCPQRYMPARIAHSGRDSSVCVSFQVPRLSRCEVFYIHAEMEICARTGCQYDGRTCDPARFARRRRAAEPLTIVDIKGPIYWINGSLGSGSTILFPNKSVVDVPFAIDDLTVTTGSNDNHEKPWPLVIVGISSAVFVLLLFVGVLAASLLGCRRRSSVSK